MPTKTTHKLLFCTNSKAFFGCVSSLIQNKIHGVTRGFLVYIRIIGVGYRAQLEGFDKQHLYLKLGFSHDIKFELPKSIRAFLFSISDSVSAFSHSEIASFIFFLASIFS